MHHVRSGFTALLLIVSLTACGHVKQRPASKPVQPAAAVPVAPVPEAPPPATPGTPAIVADAENPAAVAASPAPVVPPTPVPQDPLDRRLDQPASEATWVDIELADLFYLIGKTYRITVNVDQAVTGKTLQRFNGGTLRDLMDAITDSNDLFMERSGNSLYIRKYRTETFYINYPQVNRTTTSETSVSLSPTTTGNDYNNGLSINGRNSNTGQENQQSGGTDSTRFSVSEKSELSFWASIDDALAKAAVPGERINLNKFTGATEVTATHKRLKYWTDHFKNLNRRITAQVLVEVRIQEIVLNDEHKLGVNWSQLKTAAGDGRLIGPITTSTDITSVASEALGANTLLGNFSIGKLSGVVSALEQQGTLRTITKPSIHLLNNQKGFVKIGDDRTFWSLSNSVNVATGVTTGSTITASNYSAERQTFGVVLPVTAQVSDDDYVTLILEPARTQLNGIDTSPDGLRNSPNTNDQRISTMLRLRNNECTIIGGLTAEREAEAKEGLPLLSRIPGLRDLTGTKAKAKRTSELLITVSVHVIR